MRGTCHLRLLQLRVIGKENKKTSEDSFYSCIIKAEKTGLIIKISTPYNDSNSSFKEKYSNSIRDRKLSRPRRYKHTSFLVALF